MDFPSMKSSSILQEQPSSQSANKKSQTLKGGKNDKIQRLRTTKRKFKQFNHSNWSLRQNMAYMNFLKENSPLFSTSTTNRRSVRINVLISQVVKTRSSDQCRSHHQKMMRWHKDIPSIITHIEDLSKFFEKRQVSKPNQLIAWAQNQLQDYMEDFPQTQTYLCTPNNDDQLCEFVPQSVWWNHQDYPLF